jgi:uncharacterized protein (DUF952 family)
MRRPAWDAARAAGQVALPAHEAFLHCCTAEQLDFVLAKHFAGATDLAVLALDAASVPAKLRWEVSEPNLPPFPHIYGPIPCGAVRRVTIRDARA